MEMGKTQTGNRPTISGSSFLPACIRHARAPSVSLPRFPGKASLTTIQRLIDPREARHRAAAAKPDENLRSLLDSGNADALETMLMERLEQPADNIDFFLALVHALARRKDPEQAGLFLQLILDSLAASGNRDADLAFCTAMLCVSPHVTELRGRLLELLRAHYGTAGGFEQLAAHFDLTGAADPFAAAESLESWIAFDRGQAVYGPAYGVGTVSDVNLQIGTVKVSFQNQPGRPVSFRIGEAHKLLEPLPEEHFLRRKLEHVEDLIALAQSDPGELLRQAFDSSGTTMSLADLKTMLAGIVADKEWSTWWSKARQDRRLTVSAGSRPQLSWAGTAEQAQEAILTEFENAHGRERLELALSHAARSPELTDLIARHLVHDSQALEPTDPALAFELLLAAERIAPGSVSVSSFDSLLTTPDPAARVLAVRERNLRRRAVTLLSERLAEWQPHALELLAAESDTTILGALYDALRAQADTAGLERLVATTLATPERSPSLFLWLCREMRSREELRQRLDFPFLKALLGSLNNGALKAQFAALRKLFDPGGVVDEVVKTMNVDNARALLALLDKGINLEEYRKESVRTYVLECHPDAREQKRETLFTTAEALEAKQAEFHKLIKVDIPHNTEEMARAKAHGDLKENFEYHAARAKQEMLSSRAKTLHDQLAIAQVLDPRTVDPSGIAIGTHVTFDNDAQPYELTILGPWDSDPNNHVVSYLAPAVAALIGKRVGDTVQYDARRMVVQRIEVWK